MADASKPVERCENCRFWRQDEDDDIGQCRLRPPVIVPSMIEPDDGTDIDVHCATFFPVTYAGDWCGEHQKGAPRADESEGGA